jgi:hypothetical protein
MPPTPRAIRVLALVGALALALASSPGRAQAPAGPRGHAPVAPVEPAPPEPAVPAPAVVEAPAPPRTLRLAVYELTVDGIEPAVGRVVTQATVQEIRKLQRVSVVSMDEVRAMLDVEAQKQLAGCADDSCLSGIADSLGVDGVVLGSLSQVADGRVFGLRRLDQREARTVGQCSRRLEPAGGEEFLASVGPCIEELFPDHPLKPGLQRGVSEELALRLNPPPVPLPAFIAVAGVAGLFALSTATAGTVNAVMYQRQDELAQRALKEPVDGREITEARAQADGAAIATIALAGLTLATGAAAGIIALFTDWRGYGDAE